VRTFEEVEKLQRLETLALSAMHETERKELYRLCSQVPKNGLVVEVGCQLGCSSVVISAVGYDREYRTIHIDPYTQQEEILKGWCEQMFKLTGDWNHKFTLLCMRTEQALWHIERLCRDGIDLAFIDGDHESPNVEIDLMMVGERVKQGGYVCCHDYQGLAWPGVALGVERYMASFGKNKWVKDGQHHSMGVWRRA